MIAPRWHHSPGAAGLDPAAGQGAGADRRPVSPRALPAPSGAGRGVGRSSWPRRRRRKTTRWLRSHTRLGVGVYRGSSDDVLGRYVVRGDGLRLRHRHPRHRRQPGGRHRRARPRARARLRRDARLRRGETDCRAAPASRPCARQRCSQAAVLASDARRSRARHDVHQRERPQMFHVVQRTAPAALHRPGCSRHRRYAEAISSYMPPVVRAHDIDRAVALRELISRG